jgi:hypothetical protein
VLPSWWIVLVLVDPEVLAEDDSNIHHNKDIAIKLEAPLDPAFVEGKHSQAMMHIVSSLVTIANLMGNNSSAAARPHQQWALLLDLPTELLEEIIWYLDDEGLQSLAFLSRCLDYLILPLIFKEASKNLYKPDYEDLYIYRWETVECSLTYSTHCGIPGCSETIENTLKLRFSVKDSARFRCRTVRVIDYVKFIKLEGMIITRSNESSQSNCDDPSSQGTVVEL